MPLAKGSSLYRRTKTLTCRGALAQLPSSPSSDAAGEASLSSADGRIEASEFSEFVQRRRMVRHYSSRPLDVNGG